MNERHRAAPVTVGCCFSGNVLSVFDVKKSTLVGRDCVLNF